MRISDWSSDVCFPISRRGCVSRAAPFPIRSALTKGLPRESREENPAQVCQTGPQEPGQDEEREVRQESRQQARSEEGREGRRPPGGQEGREESRSEEEGRNEEDGDRKSTRLNASH